MPWLKDLGIFGGATVGLALVILVAAAPLRPAGVSASVSNSGSSAEVTPVSLSSAAKTAAPPVPASAWSHGLTGQVSQRVWTTSKAVAPTIVDAAAPVPTLGDAPAPDSAEVAPTPGAAVAAPGVVAPPIRMVSTTLGPTVPAPVRRWESYILKYADRYRLDPNLVAAVMMTESEGNPDATSRSGAVGLMQVVNGSYDPEENVAEGVRILADDLRKFGGDLELTVAAYNAGAGAVRRFQGIPPYYETQTYVYRVLNRYYLYSPV